MQINFTGHHVDVTPALKKFSEEKFQKLFEHYPGIISFNVTFTVEKLMKVVEVTIFVAKGELHGHAESEDMYAAIDDVREKLDKQLKKHKEKQLNHQD